MNKHALALGLAAILTAGSAIAQSATTEAPATGPAPQGHAAAAAQDDVLTLWGVRVGNPFDSATWWDAHPTGGHDDMVQVNFADPRFWVGFVDPDRHSAMHMTFTNPATMGQFFKPETYSAMMDFGTWMSWMDVSNYQPLFEAQTYAYWMQPGAYLHMIDIEGYANMVSLDAYVAAFDAAVETMGIRVN